MISIASIFAESSCTAAFCHRRSSDVQCTTGVNKCQFTAKRCQLLYATQFDVALRNTSLLFYQSILASHTLLKRFANPIRVRRCVSRFFSVLVIKAVFFPYLGLFFAFYIFCRCCFFVTEPKNQNNEPNHHFFYLYRIEILYSGSKSPKICEASTSRLPEDLKLFATEGQVVNSSLP